VRLITAQISIPMLGEIKNGDAALVREPKADEHWLAVIDGLGHGPDAAVAAQAAIARLEELPAGTSVDTAMQDMHRHLRGTRGAAATLCIIRGDDMEACAVGNVALLSVNCTVPLVLSAGVLGHQVAKFRISQSKLKPGARLALLSDGVSTRFRLEDFRQLEPALACQEIMTRYRRTHDDASVLIADVVT
jgi:negative regulator of sigma-B (phosphoserine phosphatase)